MSDQEQSDDIEGVGSAEEPPVTSQAGWDPSAHRLPVWATIREAVQALAKEWKALLKATAVATLLFGAALLLVARLLSLLYLELVWIGFWTMTAVSCHRLVILGVDSLPNAWGLYWSRRETRFLGWSFLIAFSLGAVVLPPFVFLDLSLHFSVSPDLRALGGLVFTVSVFCGAYVAARLSIVLPATAIGQRPTLKGSWRLSRSNGWRLVMVLSPAVLPGSLVFALYDSGVLEESFQSRMANDLLVIATYVLMWSIGNVLLSKAYCWFSAEIEPSTPS